MKWSYVLLLCYLGGGPALATLGSVRSLNLPSTPDVPEITMELPAPVVPPGPIWTRNSTILSVNRPWNYANLNTPTAFTLDRKRMEFIFFDVTFFGSLLSIGDNFAPPYVAVRYGYSDRLTLGFGTEIFALTNRMLAVDAKWNFMNSGSWSFSLRPALGYERDKGYFGVQHVVPIRAEGVASYLWTDRDRIHLGLGSGYKRRFRAFSKDEAIETRIFATYERRLGRGNVVHFSVIPQYLNGENSSNYQGSSGSYYYKSDSDIKGINLGLGYQYFATGFGIGIGMEAGPSWGSYSRGYGYTDTINVNNNYHYEDSGYRYSFWGMTRVLLQVSYLI